MTAAPRPASTIRPSDVTGWGFQPIPLRVGDKAPRPDKGWNTRRYQPGDWREGEGVGIRTGRQPDGTFFYIADLDSHKPGQDAPAALRAILDYIPLQLQQKLFGARSTGGKGRYIGFCSRRLLRSRQLHNSAGRHIGELLGEGSQVVAPSRDRWLFGDLATLPLLSDDELDIVLAVCGYHAPREAGHQSGPRAGRSAGGPAVIDEQELAHWRGNVDAILRRITPGTPTYQTLHSDSVPDRSRARWAMAHSLRKIWGLPSVEIAAVLLTYCDWNHSQENGSAWLEDDVRYCIGDAERKYPQVVISPTRGAAPRPPVPLPKVQPEHTQRAPGRPRSIDAYTYLDWLIARADCGKVILSRQECADALGISPATISRLEAVLREEGRLERHTARKGHRHSLSWIEILGVIKNIAQEAPAPEPIAESAPETAFEVLSEIPSRNIGTRAQEEEHTGLSIPPVPQAPPAAIDDADLADPWAWEQEQAIELPKARRIKRPKLETLPLAEQIAELKRQRRGLHGAMDLAKYRGNDSQYYRLERQAGELRECIEHLQRELAAAAPPSPGTQLGLVEAPEAVSPGACVPSSPPVVVMDRPQLDMFGPGLSHDQRRQDEVNQALAADDIKKAQRAADAMRGRKAQAAAMLQIEAHQAAARAVPA